MAHKPIVINNISLELPHKVCFSGFSAQILPGERIGIIGRNGSGKSTLLRMLVGETDVRAGHIKGLEGLAVGYVPQTVLSHDDLSGGERFNKAFTDALANQPDVLILDEPTNHLDENTKYSIMRKLNNYRGTLIIVTHDIDLLDNCVNKLWHINDGKVTVFSGNYSDYMVEKGLARAAQDKLLNDLQKEKKKLRTLRQQESCKAAKSSKKKSKDNNKMSFDLRGDNAQAKVGAKIGKLNSRLESVQDDLAKNRRGDDFVLKFDISNADTQSGTNIVSVSFGECGYGTHMVLSNISFCVSATDKVALSGPNASGKTTFIKAIMGDPNVQIAGDWYLPKMADIGYLDQHYNNLQSESTVADVIQEKNPGMDEKAVRKHLNDFLFRKNEEVFAKVSTLSGGEKARLSLAQIAAKPPKLLILDEITNNIDLETKEYIISVLNSYPGAFIVISHDRGFLDRLNLTAEYVIKNGTLK